MAAHAHDLGRPGPFLWGLAGAVFPPLIRAFGAARPEMEIPHLGLGFIFLSLGVFLGGGLWSVAMGADNRWKAMYYGATFPLVFGFLTHATMPVH